MSSSDIYIEVQSDDGEPETSRTTAGIQATVQQSNESASEALARRIARMDSVQSQLGITTITLDNVGSKLKTQ